MPLYTSISTIRPPDPPTSLIATVVFTSPMLRLSTCVGLLAATLAQVRKALFF
jgi:hypothetical protein